MDLTSAIVMSIVECYLKFYLILVAPICSLWKCKYTGRKTGASIIITTLIMTQTSCENLLPPPLQDYNSLQDPHVIILELVLKLSIGLILFASLVMTKMDCVRVANYLMLPILLGLVYLNLAYYYRLGASLQQAAPQSSQTNQATKGLRSSLSVSSSFDPIEVDELMKFKDNGRGDMVNTGTATTTTTSDTPVVDSIELFFSNGLGALTFVQLFANLLSTKRNRQLRELKQLGLRNTTITTTEDFEATTTSGQFLTLPDI